MQSGKAESVTHLLLSAGCEGDFAFGVYVFVGAVLAFLVVGIFVVVDDRLIVGGFERVEGLLVQVAQLCPGGGVAGLGAVAELLVGL